MKKCLLLLWGVALAATLQAQAPAPPAPLLYTPDQLDELLAPIALYPDPLIALILPAASDPSDVDAAAQYLAANGDPSQIDAQPWDPSVQALAHYPDVLAWMDSNLDWTEAVGLAFIQQPTEVMESIQQLRAEALAAGTLVNTPQQQVVMVGSTICIFPTDPNVIYVPQYDPDLVYEQPTDAYDAPFIVFGPGCAVGPWLDYECDWDDYGIWIGVWQPGGWAYRRDWRAPPGGRAAGAGFFRPDPRNSIALTHSFAQSFKTLPVFRPQTSAGKVAVAHATKQAPRPAVTAAPTFTAAPARVEPARPDPRGYPAPTYVAPKFILPGGSAAASSVLQTYSQNRPPAAENRAPVAESNSAPVAENRAAPVTENHSAPVVENRPPTDENSGAPVIGTRAAPVEENRQPATENRAAPVTENRSAPVTESRAAPVENNRPATPVAEVPRPATPAPAQGALFGSYNRGTDTVNNSNRGEASREAAGVAPPPARPAAPAPRPEPAPAPRPEPMPSAPRPEPAQPAGGATTERGR